MSGINCLLLVIVVFVSTVASHTGTVINVYKSDRKHASERCVGSVAFSVGRITAFSPSTLSRVLMDHEFYNKDGYFDMQTSIFTAPVAGVYAFYFGASGKSEKKGIHLYLYAGNPEKSVASAYNHNHAHGHASGFVMIGMKKGDHASMWLHPGTAINNQTPPSTHFTGYLVTEIETQC